MLFIVPLAERGVRIEVNEHDFEDSAVDNTIQNTRDQVCPEHSSRRDSRIVGVLEILRETPSFLLKGTTEHEDHQLG
jgi:hypothetical protein